MEPKYKLSEADQKSYLENGYLFAKKMFSAEEVSILLKTIEQDSLISSKAMEMADGTGGVSKVTLWMYAEDDTYGMFARSLRLAEAVKLLTGVESVDDVYHFHSKLMLKEPFVGGRWNWHQDFGYWYDQAGVLDPGRMLTAFIAVDKATIENGCLQVLRGSHKLGRLNHGVEGEQAGADLKAVDKALKRLEIVTCDMEPGDVFFLHSNTLHTSNPNKSPLWRRALLVAFNTRDNPPDEGCISPPYHPLKPVGDTAIVDKGVHGHRTSRQDFLDHETNLKSFSK
eukprot:TRINITY_DN8885_c0_g1_i1.p1 TRINITY_DN8885_c0_g1~~TRINITY_DN8885_c0_g1_i1.p1  ORF type:complete len:303 (-),score=78.45 TRINITY_DN8885_c0_g1_i1:46-894(-)